MARPYIDDTDVEAFIPEITSFESPASDFSTFYEKASEDVLNLIKAEWWPNAVTKHYGNETIDLGPLTPSLDEAHINDAALVNLTCYRAFYQYIMPYLTKDDDDDGDAFPRKAERYERAFTEEWAVVKMLPLYDFNQDGQFKDVERRGSYSRRVARR